MAEPQTLAEFASTKLESIDTGSPSLEGPNDRDVLAALGGTGTPDGGQPAPAGEEDRSLTALGLEAGAPEQKAEAPAGPLDLKIAGETIVGTVDGKDISAAELKNGFMRQSDYTRKTTEIAASRQELDGLVRFRDVNLPILQTFARAESLAQQGNSEAAEAAAWEGLKMVAKSHGIDLDAAKSNGITRASNGQFVSQSKSEFDAELQEIAESDGKDSPAYRQAVRNHELEDRLSMVTQQFDQFTNGLTRAQEAAQSRAEVENIAETWGAKGVKGIEVDKAMDLVGQPMTAQHALQVSAFGKILEWMLENRDPSRRPNQPSSQAPGGLKPESMGLAEYASQRIRF